jgi:hypothetical protein
MAAPTAAALAARLKGDNRAVVGSADPADPTKDFAATDLGEEGVKHGLTNASTATAAAYETGLARDAGEIVVSEGNGGLTKDDLRTQYFHTGNYDATKVGFGAKRCFTNSKGQPLKADGTPGTVAEAIDAETTNLSSLGEAVTSWAQTIGPDRTPAPGTYKASARASSLYVPYAGWTAQD